MGQDINFYIVLTVIIVFALVGLSGTFISLRKKRLIEDTPTSKIRSASQGYVELEGFAKAVDSSMLSAPLSGKPCLWYSYKIERHETSGKSSSWRTIESKQSKAFFALEDSTGLCYIYPEKADASSNWQDQWQGKQRHPLKQDQGKGLLSAFGGSYRYTESRIIEGDFLYGLGLFQTTRPPIPIEQAKHSMTEILNSWKQDYDALLQRFDSNGDGQLDMQEWERARQAAFAQAKQKAEQEYSDEEVHTLAKPPGKEPFILSNKDPKDLASRYRNHALLMSLLFLGACGFAVYFLKSAMV